MNNRLTLGNPVIPGWYADPEARIFEGRYWIYPTYSAPYEKQLHLDAFYSDDLVTWKKVERILTAQDFDWVHKAVWAPSPIERNGRYYLYFSANDIQSNDEIGGIGVGVSDRPEGPFQDALGKPLIDRFHHGAQPIDPHVFLDDDGQAYLYYGGWKHCNVVKLGEDMVSLMPFEDGGIYREVTPEGYVEGPCMLKRNGKYVFMWAEGGWTGPDYRVAYALSDTPLGPFNRIQTILQQNPRVATGAGHHGYFHIPDTDDYYIVYHRRPLTETDRNHRVVCIDKMAFREDGTIEEVEISNEGVSARKLDD